MTLVPDAIVRVEGRKAKFRIAKGAALGAVVVVVVVATGSVPSGALLVGGATSVELGAAMVTGAGGRVGAGAGALVGGLVGGRFAVGNAGLVVDVTDDFGRALPVPGVTGVRDADFTGPPRTG